MRENDSTSESQRLAVALDALRSDDLKIQNEGVAAAIQMGAKATLGLVSLLQERGLNQAQIMYALAQIADARAESAFLTGLRDADERVRAYAAEGLHRIGHPQALAACLQTLNDGADEAHLDRTPSVAALGEAGLKAVPALLEVLLDPDEMTRLHGQRALELIVSRCHGFRPGQGFPSEEAAERVHALWRANGDYDYCADPLVRSASVALWRKWLATATEET